jgi:hypothetical protein
MTKTFYIKTNGALVSIFFIKVSILKKIIHYTVFIGILSNQRNCIKTKNNLNVAYINILKLQLHYLVHETTN